MAQRVDVVLVDDIDGSEATETVRFGLDGSSYEIDLSASNAAKLRDALSAYVGHARKRSGGRPASGNGRRSSGGDGRRRGRRTTLTPADLRDWARSNGYEVSNRGRVPAEVREAYDAAH